MSAPRVDWQWDAVQRVHYYFDHSTRIWRRQDGSPYYPPSRVAPERGARDEDEEEDEEEGEDEEDDEEKPRSVLEDGAAALATSQLQRYSTSPSSSRGTVHGSPSFQEYGYVTQPNMHDLTSAFEHTSITDSPQYSIAGDQTPRQISYATMQREPKDSITDPKLYERGLHSRGRIRSTPGEVEPLDSQFKRQRDPKSFFVAGKVFRILWPEHPGLTTENVTVITDVGGMRGADIIAKFRWFVVVKSGTNFCSCLPISTYGRRGVSKASLLKRQHSVIYTGKKEPRLLRGEEPVENEEGMMPAIKVVAQRKDEKMDATSRIDYSRVYTVDHFVKVRNFGDVHQDYVKKLRKQWWIVFKENLAEEMENEIDEEEDDQPRFKEWVTAAYAYNDNPDMMEMQEGDRIGVTDYTTEAWWKGINLRTNKEDLFPSNYVTRGLAATN